MTRKYALIFVVIIIFILIILEGFFGTHGYFVNQELSRSLAARRFLHDEMALEVESLQKRLDAVWDEDELRDNALKLGYSVAGDTIFHFSELRHPEQADASLLKRGDAVSSEPHFKGISFWVLFMISGAIASILSIVATKLFTKHRRGKQGSHNRVGKPD